VNNVAATVIWFAHPPERAEKVLSIGVDNTMMQNFMMKDSIPIRTKLGVRSSILNNNQY
jgi:hypothetical protein